MSKKNEIRCPKCGSNQVEKDGVAREQGLPVLYYGHQHPRRRVSARGKTRECGQGQQTEREMPVLRL